MAGGTETIVFTYNGGDEVHYLDASTRAICESSARPKPLEDRPTQSTVSLALDICLNGRNYLLEPRAWDSTVTRCLDETSIHSNDSPVVYPLGHPFDTFTTRLHLTNVSLSNFFASVY